MKINLAVIFGGISVEHEISIISASQAIENLDKEKYNVIPVFMTKKGNFYSTNEFMKIENIIDFKEVEHKEINFIKDKEEVFLVKKGLFKDSKTKIDVFFPIVHGTNVEDGTLQGYLKTLGIPVCGPSVISGAVGQDKAVSKDILSANGVSQSKYVWVTKYQNIESIKEKINQKIKYPVIVKPANLGSSIGITIIENEEMLETKILEAFKYDEKVVIEEMLNNIEEYNISYLGTSEKFEHSEIEKVLKEENFLSFEDKYISSGKKLGKASKVPSQGMASLSREIPAKLPQEVKDKIIENTKTAFISLGCIGVIRFDIIVDENQNVFVNEVNNIPGSLAYYFWEVQNKNYTTLLDEIIDIAVGEHYKAQKKINSFETNVLEGYKKGN